MARAYRTYFNRIAEDWDASVPEPEELGKYLTRFGIAAGEAILDIGAGTGRVSDHLFNLVGSSGSVITADFAVKMLSSARERLDQRQAVLVCADVERLPLPDGLFDKIVCFSTFPHFLHPDRALKEMFRTLKSSGRLLILHTCSSASLNAFHASLDAVVSQDYLPRIDEMASLMKQSGFRVVQTEETDTLYWAEGIKSEFDGKGRSEA